MATANRADSLDKDSRAMLYEGLNLSQLGLLFRMDHRTLVEKLHGVTPHGKRGNAATYLVHEVAPYLVKPAYEIEDYIKRMNHTDLPKMLSKEFWAGQRSRQEYLLKEGDLWPTAKVVENVGEVLKIVKMSARLMLDAVERQTELSDRQRAIIRNLTDGMLVDAHRTVTERFTHTKGEADASSSEDL